METASYKSQWRESLEYLHWFSVKTEIVY